MKHETFVPMNRDRDTLGPMEVDDNEGDFAMAHETFDPMEVDDGDVAIAHETFVRMELT